MSSKGASWERETCKNLSLWWTNHKDETLFWRTHSSGARFTVLKRKGKHLHGQAGDIAAVDHRGRRLLDVFSISLKRGYSGRTFQDLIDALDKVGPDSAKPEQEYAGWIREAIECEHHADALSWMIIVRRDQRQALIIVPIRFRFFLTLSKQKELAKLKPQMSMTMWVHRKSPLNAKDKKKLTMKQRIAYNKGNKRYAVSIMGFRMDHFLKVVDKKTILQIAKSNASTNKRK